MKDAHLIKLIKIWQLKLCDYAQEYDWGTEEMMELLKTFGCKQIAEEDGFKTYTEADMYMIWEYANTWYTEDECSDPVFNNPEADKILQIMVEDNRNGYEKYWMDMEERRRKEIEEERAAGKR